MPSDMRIIEAGSQHLDAIARLFDAYRVFYRQPTDVAAATRFIAERFARRDSVIYLALAGETPAGFAQLYPSLSSVSMRPIWILNDLFVAHEFRGRGVGRRLMDRCRELASASGAVRVELTTERTNTTAQALYESVGYARDEVFFKYLLTVDTRA